MLAVRLIETVCEDLDMESVAVRSACGFVNLTRHVRLSAGIPSPAAPLCSDACDLAPDLKALMHGGAVVGGAEQATAGAKEVAGPAEGGEESLCLSR